MAVLRVLHTVMAAAAATTADTPDGQTASDAAAAAGSSTSSTSSTGAATIVDSTNDFYSTGRVGRRNALPDILHQQHSYTSTAGLAGQLGAMSTKDADAADVDEAGAGCSSKDANIEDEPQPTEAANQS